MINRLTKTDSESKESYWNLECEWELEHMIDVNIVFFGEWNFKKDFGASSSLLQITFLQNNLFLKKIFLNSLSPYILVQF